MAGEGYAAVTSAYRGEPRPKPPKKAPRAPRGTPPRRLPTLKKAMTAVGTTAPPPAPPPPAFSAGSAPRFVAGEGVPGEEPLPSPGDPGFEAWVASCQDGFTWLRSPAIVSVAAVRGHAIGAGLQLALACDLRVLADDAQLCVKEPALGLVPDLTGTKPLVDILGLPRAVEMSLTARTVGAAEASRLRLAELVVPAADLDAAVADLVAALLATDAAAARATKELLSQASSNSLEEQAAAERPAQTALPRARLAAKPSVSAVAVSSPGKILAAAASAA